MLCNWRVEPVGYQNASIIFTFERFSIEEGYYSTETGLATWDLFDYLVFFRGAVYAYVMSPTSNSLHEPRSGSDA
eukprot:scaffold347_cov380-Prasinococcus_capsulatus_cf.AAC.9